MPKIEVFKVGDNGGVIVRGNMTRSQAQDVVDVMRNIHGVECDVRIVSKSDEEEITRVKLKEVTPEVIPVETEIVDQVVVEFEPVVVEKRKSYFSHAWDMAYSFFINACRYLGLLR